ncbi:MAG: hypothetical protein ACOCQ4_00910 [bacterium]
MANYKCNQCGHAFKSNAYIDECPKCRSRKIEPVEGVFQQFLKKNWRILTIIVLIIATGVLVFTTLIDTGSNHKYQVTFSGFDDGVEIVIYKYTINKDGKKEERERLATGKAEKIVDAYQFKVIDNIQRTVARQGTKIYPCAKGKTDTLAIKWNNNEKYPLLYPDQTEEVYYFTLKSNEPNKQANCRNPKEKIRILSVDPISKCRLKVTTNKDSTGMKDQVLISINGKEGPFENKRIWSAKNYNKINIYAVLQGDTAAAPGNGAGFYPHDCVECNDEKIANLRQNLINAGNAYGTNPDDVNKVNKFRKLIANSNPVFYLNGNKIGDWSTFKNKLNVESFNNADSKYKIMANGLRINESNCTVSRIEFKSK